jgi:hypothetical protein
MLDMPKFYEPSIVFETDKQTINQPMWSRIADLVLSSDKGDISHFMDDQKPYRNLPFVFKQVNEAKNQKTSIRKDRRAGITILNTIDFTRKMRPKKSNGIFDGNNMVIFMSLYIRGIISH